MVVVMAPGATEAQVEAVIARVRQAGGEAFVSRGVSRTIIGLVGDVEQFRALNLRRMAGVAEVIRVSTPYKLVSRHHFPSRSTVVVGGSGGRPEVRIGPEYFTLIAGPCAVESLDQILETAELAKAAGATLLRGGTFRPWSSAETFRGLGRSGLHMLAEAGAATGLPVVTEAADARDVEAVAEQADMLQVGARNMQNFALLDAVAQSGKPVLLKRGIQATIEEWLMAAEYIAQRGNLNIVLCERGIRTFEPTTPATLDISAVPTVQRLSHLPVVVDPTHASGRRDLVLPLARAVIAVGSDGVLIDVHPDPESALCDGPQALAGADVRVLASAIRRLAPLLDRDTADVTSVLVPEPR
ncbi:3-deoxy-7-phosphoheptulonate synthase [Phytoactinopolyspora halotolerans]|uniref:3-deoxy-7-phosphoheptulonate synthase n=1 Tax=Phytoactinopolyspora halotolerans TaxID=1981512 RepID=A0A6L9SBB8_9ACTN|nr:3-deoxy-7-phosphoheptulonate synthase [Phytoactinopolyspora halotolerans]NEE01841.1 3-deoxy-7-phosphoheptulonate synthase [Phytoactinopolyspora halotolerans]